MQLKFENYYVSFIKKKPQQNNHAIKMKIYIYAKHSAFM